MLATFKQHCISTAVTGLPDSHIQVELSSCSLRALIKSLCTSETYLWQVGHYLEWQIEVHIWYIR